MSEIPRDIMEAAWETGGAIRIKLNEIAPNKAAVLWGTNGVIEAMDAAIARAILAERERAAREGYRVCAETRHVTLGDKVAAAIRSDHTASMEAAAPGYGERRTLITGETGHFGKVYSPGRRRAIKEGE